MRQVVRDWLGGNLTNEQVATMSFEDRWAIEKYCIDRIPPDKRKPKSRKRRKVTRGFQPVSPLSRPNKTGAP
jgi:ribosomal protein S2